MEDAESHGAGGEIDEEALGVVGCREMGRGGLFMPRPAHGETRRGPLVAPATDAGKSIHSHRGLRAVGGLDAEGAVAVNTGRFLPPHPQPPVPAVEGGLVAGQGLGVAAATGEGYLLLAGGGAGLPARLEGMGLDR